MRKNSIGIFVVFAENGSIDDYVFYLVQKLKDILEELIVTINGIPNDREKEILLGITDKIYIRDNMGYDCGAYKETMEKYIGWEQLKHYDELLLVNDSCYGPIYPLDEVYEKMDSKELDFWGITEQTPIKGSQYDTNLLPYHVQSYFLVVKSKMLHSKEFRDFWENVSVSNDYNETVAGFELKFTKYFNDLGYKSGAYIDCTAFCTRTDVSQAYVFFDSYRLVSEHHCPFIKKKVFLFPHALVLTANAGETARRTLNYVREHTVYDENLILQNLIRKCDPGDLRVALHLDYCFSTKELEQNHANIGNVLLIAHVSYTYLIDQCFAYLNRLPSYIDIIISTKGDENIDIVTQKIEESKRKNIKLVVPKDRGREISSLLVACREEVLKHDYVGFVHDKQSNSGTPYHTVGQSFMNILWDNSVYNEIYVENVLNQLANEPQLGILGTPVPYMSKYFMVTAMSWSNCFEKTTELCEKIHIPCNIEKDKHPFMLGTTFWCKKEALFPLFSYKWSYEDFEPEPMPTDGTISHAIERIFPYVAKAQGYYSGIMMTEEYASLYACNYQYMLNGIIKNILMEQGIYAFRNVMKVNSELITFCKNNDKLYIYGAGEYGHRCRNYLQDRGLNVLGYIVSDGKKEVNLTKEDVYELSEIPCLADVGIIVAVSKANCKTIKCLLDERGIKNYIFYEE